jgi:hypothetical protein
VRTDPRSSSSAPRSCWEPRCWHSRPESTRGRQHGSAEVIAPAPGPHLGDQGGLAQPVPVHGIHGSSHE